MKRLTRIAALVAMALGVSSGLPLGVEMGFPAERELLADSG